MRRSVPREYRDRMRGIELFADCTDAEIDALDALVSEARIDSGREVTRAGKAGREFVVVVEGSAEVVRDGEVVATLGPGSFFGEQSLLAGSLRNATVRAATPMRILVSDRSQFDRLLDQVPSVAARIHEADQARG